MIKVYLVILAVSSVIARQVNKEGQNAILAISWLGGFCHKMGDCLPEVLNNWDKQSFLIHGLWPDQQFENQYENFNISLFKGQFLNQMKMLWPPKRRQSNPDNFLWDHQYQFHGKYYAKIYHTYHPHQFSRLKDPKKLSDALQIQYFNDTIKLFNTFNVKKVPKEEYTRIQLGQLLGLRQNQFVMACYPKNGVAEATTIYLVEIKICVTIKRDGIVKRTCEPTRTDQNCRPGSINLMGWKLNRNALVFKPWP